ncbi:MAG: virulence RhuM family protein [Alkalispirochaeta sp.]
MTNHGEILVYQTNDGAVRLDVRLQDETVWLTQAMMAELFACSIDNISLHLRNIYEEGELNPEPTSEDFSIVRTEGSRQVIRSIRHYNLDAIISVGYRVKSKVATRFRIWETERLKEYLVKGFTMDDERLRNPSGPGTAVPDYFDELLERIRDIRASERRMYLRVREIFAMAADYDPDDKDTLRFFRVIQNKLHFAATGKTAAELIRPRANAELANTGLTSWKGDEVRKSGITIAKNYLAADEVTELNRIVTMWLDYAEDQARRRKRVFMQDWEQKLDDFLRFNDRDVLPNVGSVSKGAADDRELRKQKGLLGAGAEIFDNSVYKTCGTMSLADKEVPEHFTTSGIQKIVDEISPFVEQIGGPAAIDYDHKCEEHEIETEIATGIDMENSHRDEQYPITAALTDPVSTLLTDSGELGLRELVGAIAGDKEIGSVLSSGVTSPPPNTVPTLRSPLHPPSTTGVFPPGSCIVA